MTTTPNCENCGFYGKAQDLCKATACPYNTYEDASKSEKSGFKFGLFPHKEPYTSMRNIEILKLIDIAQNDEEVKP